MNDDNVISLFEKRVERAGATIDRTVDPPPEPPPPALPDENEIGHLESLVSDLSFAVNDKEKVDALKQVAHWLTQWKF